MQVTKELLTRYCWRCPYYCEEDDLQQRCIDAYITRAKQFQNLKYKVGDRIKFVGERMSYTIRACDERYIIATKPFNLEKTFLYTIVDLRHQVRGSDNHYCLYEYTNEKEARKALKALNKKDSEFEISWRNMTTLKIEKIKETT